MSESFKIERGIPVPTRVTKYPLRTMKVGDSFLMPFSAGPNCDINVRTCARYVARSISGFRILIRKESRGWRVWRAA